MGHEAVKADIVAHLTDDLAPWITVVAVDDWPPAPERIVAGDILPVDEDKPWPCVLVTSTSMGDHHRTAALGDATFIGEYSVKITAAVRTSKSKDDADAAAGRDRLLLALRYLLITSPKAGDTTVLTSTLTEQTDPVAVDPKGRMVALGSITVTARHVESIPDLGAVEVVDAAVTDLAVTTADGSLYSETTTGYDGPIVYDAPHVTFDGATEYPPKP